MEAKIYQMCLANDLPKDLWSNYGHQRDRDFNVLVVTHNGEIIMHKSDRMEPEDASFYRSLNFVVDWVTRAYNLGRQQGLSEGHDEALKTLFSDDHVESPSEPR